VKNSYTIIQILGAISAAIGLLSIAGYITGIKWFYNWYGTTKMALNTAVEFTIQGLVIVWICQLLKNDKWHK